MDKTQCSLDRYVLWLAKNLGFDYDDFCYRFGELLSEGKEVNKAFEQTLIDFLEAYSEDPPKEAHYQLSEKPWDFV